MASTSNLQAGTPVIITAGPFALNGPRNATVINPTVEPHGSPYQRKILVEIDGIGQEYVLPRLLVQPGLEETINAKTPLDDPMDPALDRFRPNETIVNRYISRTMKNGMSDVDFMLSIRDDRDTNGYSPNVAMTGPTQGGKSMLIQVLAVMAARRDGLPKPYPVFTMSGSSGVSSYDLFGMNTAVEIKGRESIVWMNGLVALWAHVGGFLDLEEWNAMDAQQSTALHSCLDDRRYFVNMQRAVSDGHGGYMPEKVTLNQACWVICTINPGYKGTRAMNEATTNRFRWIPWDYDDEVEAQLIPSSDIRNLGAALRNLHMKNSLTMPTGTSALMRLHSDCIKFGGETALWMFQGMYPPHDQDKVDAAYTTGGIADLITAKFS